MGWETGIGGGDRQSSVYVYVSFRGQQVMSSLSLSVMDFGEYDWDVHGWAVHGDEDYVLQGFTIFAPSGVPYGSYIVQVNAQYEHNGKTYYGTTTYIIECRELTT